MNPSRLLLRWRKRMASPTLYVSWMPTDPCVTGDVVRWLTIVIAR